MPQDFWNLTRKIAVEEGKEKVIKQCDEHIEAINREQEKLDNQLKLLADL